MVIIKKNRLFFIMLVTIISVISAIEYEKNNNDIIDTVALPVSNKVIVLDAGHGLPDERCF